MEIKNRKTDTAFSPWPSSPGIPSRCPGHPGPRCPPPDPGPGDQGGPGAWSAIRKFAVGAPFPGETQKAMRR